MSLLEKALAKMSSSKQAGQGQPSLPAQSNDEAISRENATDSHNVTPLATRKLQRRNNTVHLDLDNIREFGMLASEEHQAIAAEQYRRMKRPILKYAFDKNGMAVDKGNLAIITSAVPGEGKSYSAVNLALSIARERDKTVLLIDADVAKRQISKIFEVETRTGLMDYLENDSIDASSVILNTDVHGLSVVAAGEYRAHSSELLASQRMERFVQEVASRYPDRMVIFDSPPLLATSEGNVLCGLMGQVVFVVEALGVPKTAVMEALSTLDADKPISLVLNKSTANTGSKYGGYYGYHQQANR